MIWSLFCAPSCLQTRITKFYWLHKTIYFEHIKIFVFYEILRDSLWVFGLRKFVFLCVVIRSFFTSPFPCCCLCFRWSQNKETNCQDSSQTRWHTQTWRDILNSWVLVVDHRCLRSSASPDLTIPRGHEDLGRGKGGDPLQVFWCSTHQLYLAEVQETSKTHARSLH